MFLNFLIPFTEQARIFMFSKIELFATLNNSHFGNFVKCNFHYGD